MALFKLSDAKWDRLSAKLPAAKVSSKGGRPKVSNRRCFEGILWMLRTGAQWSELPKEYGSGSTCWRRLREWETDGTLLKLWRAFLSELSDKQKIKWDECFVDGSFASAKKGAPLSEKRSVARVQSG